MLLFYTITHIYMHYKIIIIHHYTYTAFMLPWVLLMEVASLPNKEDISFDPIVYRVGLGFRVEGLAFRAAQERGHVV
jgi:hypothetical protein